MTIQVVREVEEFKPFDFNITIDTELELNVLLALSRMHSSTIHDVAEGTPFEIEDTVGTQVKVRKITAILHKMLEKQRR